MCEILMSRKQAPELKLGVAKNVHIMDNLEKNWTREAKDGCPKLHELWLNDLGFSW